VGKGGDVDEITGGPQVILHPFTRTWPLLVNVNPSRSMLEGLLETGSPTITNDYKRLQTITTDYHPLQAGSRQITVSLQLFQCHVRLTPTELQTHSALCVPAPMHRSGIDQATVVQFLLPGYLETNPDARVHSKSSQWLNLLPSLTLV
jgi:hypothetical protein